MALLQTHCVGSMRISVGTWYSPIGKTPSECTYCEFCVVNGCADRSKVYQITEPVQNCNCDCPIAQNHPQLKKYECHKCITKSGFMTCDMSTCHKCNVNRTTSSCIKYCNACSAIYGICVTCGDERI